MFAFISDDFAHLQVHSKSFFFCKKCIQTEIYATIYATMEKN